MSHYCSTRKFQIQNSPDGEAIEDLRQSRDKSQINSKFKCSKFKTMLFKCFEFRILIIGAYLLFGALDFGFPWRAVARHGVALNLSADERRR